MSPLPFIKYLVTSGLLTSIGGKGYDADGKVISMLPISFAARLDKLPQAALHESAVGVFEAQHLSDQARRPNGLSSLGGFGFDYVDKRLDAVRHHRYKVILLNVAGEYFYRLLTDIGPCHDKRPAVRRG